MSQKPLAERLQVKAERRLAVIDAPAGLQPVIGAADRRAEASQAEVVLVFIRSQADLTRQVTSLLERINAKTILWVAYPKLSSVLAGELNRDIIRQAAPQHGLETVSQIAIDEDWSALRLKRVG